MTTAATGQRVYRNPVLHADWSDPDVIRVGDDFFLVASSFHRVPGLPVLWSPDLVGWTIVGHGLDRLEPRSRFASPQHGCGVWAPAIRHHNGRFWIFYPDPDRGIFVITATDPAGGWTPPYLLKAGRGLIDPCPLWNDDGTAYLVHAWAKSRAGFNNRITCHRMSTDATRLLDGGTTVIDGDLLEGYRTLEGPKVYRRDDWYWIFAPAGGVATGWQSAFRARDVFGPYEERIVLAQGDTAVNGPHQGAWVDTPGGEDWFLHFQDRGAYGRVVHLQPMRWSDDGWPVIGQRHGPGTPVLSHPVPAGVTLAPVGGPAASDDFSRPDLGPQWSWQANPDPHWWTLRRPRGLRLSCVPSPSVADLRQLPQVLGQRLPAESFQATTAATVTTRVSGARAGLTILGETYAWIGLERRADGDVLVMRTADRGGGEQDAVPPRPVPADRPTVTLGVRVGPGAVCQFLAGVGADEPAVVGGSFTATPGHWVGATLGLFAAAPPGGDPGGDPGGHADFTDFRVTVDDA